jgi:acyl-CoA synthetase (AMP-forming)/AMP-acid ligase II
MENIFRLLMARTDHASRDVALITQSMSLSYQSLAVLSERVSNAILELGLEKLDRVAIFLDKRPETAAAIFGAACAGVIFVPIDPQLEPHQVDHVLRDSDARLLITTTARYRALRDNLQVDTLDIILCDGSRGDANLSGLGHSVHPWADIVSGYVRRRPGWLVVDQDPAAILYTLRSAGTPKGTVLSHEHLRARALGLAQYLSYTAEDVVLSLLPISVDPGLSELAAAIATGASLVLHNYTRPAEVVRLCERHPVTAMTGIASVWKELISADWSEEATSALRLFANTGEPMPRDLRLQLRQAFPQAEPYLMHRRARISDRGGAAWKSRRRSRDRHDKFWTGKLVAAAE